MKWDGARIVHMDNDFKFSFLVMHLAIHKILLISFVFLLWIIMKLYIHNH